MGFRPAPLPVESPYKRDRVSKGSFFTLVCDGACSGVYKATPCPDGVKRGRGKIAWLLLSPGNRGKKLVRCHAERWGKLSSNEAEYRAVISGLEAGVEMGVERLRVLSDSRLLVSAMTRAKAGKGCHRASPHLADLVDEAMELVRRIEVVYFFWHSRSGKWAREVDRLAKDPGLKDHFEKLIRAAQSCV